MISIHFADGSSQDGIEPAGVSVVGGEGDIYASRVKQEDFQGAPLVTAQSEGDGVGARAIW